MILHSEINVNQSCPDTQGYYRRIREENDIGTVARELLSTRITAEQNGTLHIDCPHHASQSHLSLHVDKNKQLWHCFGCNLGGDVLQFVEFVQSGVVTKGDSGPMPETHRKARDYLAQRSGLVALSKAGLSPEEICKTEEREAKAGRTFECLTLLADFYHKRLTGNEEALRAFEDQYGISRETVESLKIGFADGPVVKHLEGNGFSQEEILSTGAFVPDKKGNVHAFLKKRFTFPYWLQGAVRYAIGRKTRWTENSNFERGKYKKLLTCSEKHSFVSPAINNSTLYGEDILLSRPDYVLVTEGVTDQISAEEHGIPCVSPVTTRIKHEDWKRIIPKLKRVGIKKVFLVGDNEISKAGEGGAEANAKNLAEQGFEARIVELTLDDSQVKARDALQELYNITPELTAKEVAAIKKELPPEQQPDFEQLAIQAKQDLNSYFINHSREEFEELLKTARRVIGTPLESEHTGEGEESDKPKRPNRFKVLMSLLDRTDREFFHDQFGSAWACLTINGHRENVRIKSDRFKHFLSGMYYEATEEGVGRETIQQVQDLCTSRAIFQGQQRTLSCRVAWGGENEILIDLGTQDWTAIRVTPEGWDIIRPEKPPFRRFAHMKQLPTPERGGTVKDILRILPIKDETSKILITAWLPTAFVPDIPRPGIILSGLQGSGKTFTTERLRELIDPSASLTLSLSKNSTELIQALDHHYLPALDNLDSLPKWASDVLCRAVSGAGFTKRELFSDDDDFCYHFFRPFVLNGISVCASRPDLLDRSLIVELDRIPPNERKPLKALLSEFKSLQPKILGATLDALSAAMRKKDTLSMDALPRLADWCEWAVLVAEQIGFTRDEFLQALQRNIQRQHTEITTGHPLAIAVLHFMADKPEWEGAPSELYGHLSEIAEDLKLDKEKAWPKASNAMSTKLKAISHNLAAAGLDVTDDRTGHKRTRTITITKKPDEASEYPEMPSASSDRPQSNDSNTLTADDTADDTEPDAVRTTVRGNLQESLSLDDADSAADESGYSDPPDDTGCAPCLYTRNCHRPPGDRSASECPDYNVI